MGIWNDFLGPLIYLHTPEKQTIQVLIASMQAMYIGQSDYPMIMAAAIIAMVPVIIVFFSAKDTLSNRWQSAESRVRPMPIRMPRLSKIACCIGALGLAAGLALSGCDTITKPEAVDMEIYNEMYANPFPSLEEEWEDYGNGDPYVLRHDGRYYLYVSTKDHRTGIKAWVSDNLVDWSYAGLVTEDPVSTGAYAPK